jgi:hypothetical protein
LKENEVMDIIFLSNYREIFIEYSSPFFFMTIGVPFFNPCVASEVK